MGGLDQKRGGGYFLKRPFLFLFQVEKTVCGGGGGGVCVCVGGK